VYKYRQQLGGVILLQAPRPTTPDAYDDAWFFNLPCGTKQPGRPAQLTRYGPLLLDEATPFQVPHPDGQGRYYMIDRHDFSRMRREAAGGLQRAAVRLEVGDMCASPLVPVATIAAPRSSTPCSLQTSSSRTASTRCRRSTATARASCWAASWGTTRPSRRSRCGRD